MVTLTQQSPWKCVRDYWRLEIVGRPPSVPQRISLRGRRRTSEPYSVPLTMDGPALDRLHWALQSAIAVATGFQATGIRDCRSRFPTRVLLARCRGPFYELQIHGTAVAGDIESVELTVVADGHPVVYLIDADIELFAADVAEALDALSNRSGHTDEPQGSS